VNEPSFTAVASALFGIWNDRRRSKRDWADALCHVVLANLEANARIRADRDGWWVGAESFTCPVAVSEAHAAEAERVRATAWAVWDLHFGMPLDPAVERDFDAVRDTRQRIEKLATRRNDRRPRLLSRSVVRPACSTAGRSAAADAYEGGGGALARRYGSTSAAETSNPACPWRSRRTGLAFAPAARHAGGEPPGARTCWYSCATSTIGLGPRRWSGVSPRSVSTR
jgi:hypothetical protein